MLPTDALEVSPAALVEAPALARMSRDYIETGLAWRWQPPFIRGLVRDTDTVVLCARSAEKGQPGIAGFAAMFFELDTAHLLLLAVKPEARRLGVGTRLLSWLEKSARVAGVTDIVLEVRARNTGAREFYRRLGYVEREYVPGYYSGTEAALRMTKTLRRATGADA